MDNKQIFH